MTAPRNAKSRSLPKSVPAATGVAGVRLVAHGIVTPPPGGSTPAAAPTTRHRSRTMTTTTPTEGLTETLDTAWQAAQSAWYAADEAWSAELRAMYGNDARDARYDDRCNAASPALARLNGTRLAARAAYDATRNTALVFKGVRDAAERGGR